MAIIAPFSSDVLALEKSHFSLLDRILYEGLGVARADARRSRVHDEEARRHVLFLWDDVYATRAEGRRPAAFPREVGEVGLVIHDFAEGQTRQVGPKNALGPIAHAPATGVAEGGGGVGGEVDSIPVLPAVCKPKTCMEQ